MVSRDKAWGWVMLPLAAVSLMHACHDLVPTMPADMAIAIIAGIAFVVVLAVRSDGRN